MAIIVRLASKATPSKVVKYVTKEEKTEEKLISGKDCSPENVVNEFNVTKELYNKNNGIKYHHVIQSFSPEDKINPEKAHELGKELAEKQFKGHEVLIATHKDKDHIHNHLVVNSVNFENGLKYKSSNKSLWDIKRESNRICERENLKTINLDKKAPERTTSAELRMSLRGQVPFKKELKECINFTKERTSNLKDFTKYLKDKFDIKTRVTKKNISYQHPDKKKSTRGSKLGAKFDKEELENEFTRKSKSNIRGRTDGKEEKSTNTIATKKQSAIRENGKIDTRNDRAKSTNARIHKSSDERGHSKENDNGQRARQNPKDKRESTKGNDFDIEKARRHTEKLRKSTAQSYGKWKEGNQDKQQSDDRENGGNRGNAERQHGESEKGKQKSLERNRVRDISPTR